MKTTISFIEKGEISPLVKTGDICGNCRARGFNLCKKDEICQLRLADALDRPRAEIDVTLESAGHMGFLKVREEKVDKKRPRKFIKMSNSGRIVLALMK